MPRVYVQQKRPGAKAAEPSYNAPAVHAPSLVSGQSGSDLDALMQAKYRQHFLDNQIPTAEAEADRIAASVSGARTPEEVKTRLGEKMGADFSSVTFHTDSAALKQADAMGARAYTTGSDVYFGSGGFDPGVAAHELVHTVQQGMVGSTMQTTTAPTGGVQMKPGRIREFFRSLMKGSKPKQQQQQNPQKQEMSGKQKVATNILKGFVMQNNAGLADLHNRAMKGYLEALQLQEEYKKDPSKEIKSMYKENKIISMDEFDQEVALSKEGLEYYINLCNTGVDQKSAGVDLSGLDEDAMLDNAVKAQGVMADFPGLDVRAIRGVDTYSEGGDLPDEALMGASSGIDRMVQINKDLWKSGGERSSSPGWSAAEENYTLTHELGHMTNYHLADQFNKEHDGENPLCSDQVSRAIMAEALSDQAKEDENLRTMLYANAGLDEKAELTDQASVRAISDALAPVGESQEKSQLMQALLAANYTSGYGSADPIEMYAEAFAAHYENQDAGEHAKNSPAAQLGRHIVNRSKDLFHSKKRRNSFAQRHWG